MQIPHFAEQLSHQSLRFCYLTLIWDLEDLNLAPKDYESSALTEWAKIPKIIADCISDSNRKDRDAVHLPF